MAKYNCYVSPKTGAPLTFYPEGDSKTEGVLRAADGESYRVTGGLPRFVEDEGYSASFGFQWHIHDETQLDSHTKGTATADRFFRGTHWPHDMKGQTILEVGCGSGRFTEVLVGTGATVCSVDFSRAAEVTARHFGDRVEVAQASIYDLPFAKGSFDRVFCYGVIQHCPDVRQAFMKLVEMMKPGGHLAVDVYDKRRQFLNARYRVRWLTKRLPKEMLYDAIRKIVPLYMKVMPPLHPFNQLVVPIKDYRGRLGLSRENEIEQSILDTFDALSPAYDLPQFKGTMIKWCKAAGLVDIEAQHGGNGVEVRARRPA